jgi:hypothetical protein
MLLMDFSSKQLREELNRRDNIKTPKVKLPENFKGAVTHRLQKFMDLIKHNDFEAAKKEMYEMLMYIYDTHHEGDYILKWANDNGFRDYLEDIKSFFKKNVYTMMD